MSFRYFSPAIVVLLVLIAFSALTLFPTPVLGELNTEIATINVGNSPRALAVDESANKLYVTNTFSNTVSVIDTTNDINSEIVPAIAVGSNPKAVVVHEGAKRLYVANTGSNSISVINTLNNQNMDIDIPVGPQPISLAINESANRLYVANEGQVGGTGWGWVSVINTVTNQNMNIDMFTGYKVAVAVDEAANRLYIANAGWDGTISVIDTQNDANTLVTRLDFQARIANLAVDENTQRLYVTTFDPLTELIVFNTQNNTRIAEINLPNFTHSFGLAANASYDRVYIANLENARVRVLDTLNDANTFSVPISVGEGPTALAVNTSAGRLYVANRYSTTVSVVQIEKAGEANLSVKIRDHGDPMVMGGTHTAVMPGDSIVYTVTVTNAGPSPATSVFLADIVPSGFTYNSGASTQPDCPQPVGADVTCVLGDVAQGEERVLTLVFDPPQVNPPVGWVYTTVEVISPTNDANYSDNMEVEQTYVPTAHDLTITIDDNEDPLFGPSIALDGITYTVTVTNNGPQVALNTRIHNPIPPWGWPLGYLSTPGWAGFSAVAEEPPLVPGPTGVFIFDVPELAPQASISADIVIKPFPSLIGTFVNPVTVSSRASDIDPSNNSASETTELIERVYLASGTIMTFALPAGEQGWVSISEQPYSGDLPPFSFTPNPDAQDILLEDFQIVAEVAVQFDLTGATCQAGCTISFTFDWFQSLVFGNSWDIRIYRSNEPPNGWTELPTVVVRNADGTYTATATTYSTSFFVIGTASTVSETVTNLITIVSLAVLIAGFFLLRLRRRRKGLTN